MVAPWLDSAWAVPVLKGHNVCLSLLSTACGIRLGFVVRPRFATGVEQLVFLVAKWAVREQIKLMQLVV